jgi:hypothetical protein
MQRMRRMLVMLLWEAGRNAAVGPYTMMGPQLGAALKQSMPTEWNALSPGNKVQAACEGSPWLRMVNYQQHHPNGSYQQNKAAQLVRHPVPPTNMRMLPCMLRSCPYGCRMWQHCCGPTAQAAPLLQHPEHRLQSRYRQLLV